MWHLRNYYYLLRQDYGPKVNFKRQRVVPGRFTGLPSYSRFLVDRINQTIQTSHLRQTFIPVELCNLEYCPERGASIVPHLDDAWLWGDRLVTLNLCSSTTLIFTLPNPGSPEVLAEFERIRSDLGQQAEIYVAPFSICYYSHRVTWLFESRCLDAASLSWMDRLVTFGIIPFAPPIFNPDALP
ncbi:alkylated DNA repair protein alkB homolog 4 [Clonorchis sinensis]|uniref:Alkylated DNA repair protein alkB homolog 4 n=1 Tax=Clonorchis sinensis TaxID=79923 RepID=G7YS92_CLOSI|nr:alkylated DNA repair protein alkB homolog 4 [Clonorchis sinensis]